MDRPDARAWTGPRDRFADVGRSGMSDEGRSAEAGRSTIRDGAGNHGTPHGVGDDLAIVAAVLAGDRDAFRRLVERESASVIRACHRILGDHAEAEDAAQEAFVTAYRSLATWRSDGPFGAWITRIAVRIALRQAGKRRTVAWRDPTGVDASDDAPSAADRAADRNAVEGAAWTDPALLSMRSERASEIRGAVAALPEPYREVVALRFFGDASLDEIARQTGRPLGTVKTHLHRGLARLRTVMETER